MKKILVCVALLTTAMSVNAQKFKLGLGGGFNSTWLMNKNVFDADDNLDIAMTFGGSFGLKAQYYFNDKVGLELGVMTSGHNQKYEGDIPGTDESYEVKDKLRYLDVPLLLRLGGDKGGYFEFGPQFGFLSKVTEDGSAAGLSYDDEDVKNSFNSTNVAAVVGFGVDVDASEHFTITAGLRLGYSFTDVTKEYDGGDFGDDDISLATSAAHVNDKGNLDYKSTGRLFGGLHLGILYTIPTGTKAEAK